MIRGELQISNDSGTQSVVDENDQDDEIADVKLVRPKAQQGDATAQFKLADYYRRGWAGGGTKHAECIGWYRLAAVQGHVEAQCSLGAIYGIVENFADGYVPSSIVDPDFHEAVKWWQLAAKQGNLNAQRMLDSCWRDHDSLVDLRNAAADGDASAQKALGDRYLKGVGVAMDEAGGVNWLKRAADQRHSGAQVQLGFWYQTTKSTMQDDIEASKWYLLAAESGDRVGMFDLGTMCANGHGVAQDFKQAMSWFLKAAQEREAEPKWFELYDGPLDSAQFSIAALFEEGLGVPQSAKKASAWYKKAADAGHEGAQIALGRLYASGDGVSQDLKKSVKWYRLAAEQSNPTALKSLGALYAKGEGVPQNSIAAYALSFLALTSDDRDEDEEELLNQANLSAEEIEQAEHLLEQMNQYGNLLKALDKYMKRNTPK